MYTSIDVTPVRLNLRYSTKQSDLLRLQYIRNCDAVQGEPHFPPTCYSCFVYNCRDMKALVETSFVLTQAELHHNERWFFF